MRLSESPNELTRIVACNRLHEIGIASNRVVVRHGETTTRDVLITRQIKKEVRKRNSDDE